MARSRPRARRLLPWLATILLTLFGASEVAVAVHQLIVPHQTCYEHQESVHAHRAAVGPTPEQSSKGLRVVAHADEGPEVHLHSHCGLISVLQLHMVGTPTRSSLSFLYASGPSSPSFHDLGWRAVELLHVAPKASPPGLISA